MSSQETPDLWSGGSRLLVLRSPYQPLLCLQPCIDQQILPLKKVYIHQRENPCGKGHLLRKLLTYDLPKYEHGINVYIWWFQLRAVKTRVGPFGVDCPKITPFLFVSQPGQALVRKDSNPGLEKTILGCNELAKSS